ncbi:hypothetical protein GEMRC1_000742 [Eukaryota sp. GEM-RC1]
MLYLSDSSDSDDDAVSLASYSSTNLADLKHHQFFQELPPISVITFSLSDSYTTISQYTAVLKQSISSDSPFIAVKHSSKLPALLISTPDVVLVIYIDAPLHAELKDLLLSPHITKVHSSPPDIKTLNRVLNVTIDPSISVTTNLNQIRIINLHRSGSKLNLKKRKRAWSIFAALGLTPITVSLDIESGQQVYKDILSVFGIAFYHHLSLVKKFDSVPIPVDHPCCFLSSSPYDLIQLNLSETFAFRHIVPHICQNTNPTCWLTDIEPFCCDLHAHHFLISCDVFHQRPHFHFNSYLSPFAHFIYSFVSHDNNKSIFESVQHSSFDYSDPVSVVENCLKALLDCLKSLNQNYRNKKLEVLSLLREPNKHRNFTLLVLHNLLVLNLRIDSTKVNDLVVTESMFNDIDKLFCFQDILDGLVIDFVSQFLDSKQSIITPAVPAASPGFSSTTSDNDKSIKPLVNADQSDCGDSPNGNDDEMFFDCIDTSCDENHPSLSKFLNSIPSKNPRVLILVKAVAMVVDTVFLVTDTCSLKVAVKPDHVLPSSIVELFLDDDVIKEIISTQFSLSDFASFFSLPILESFTDRTLFFRKRLPLFFSDENFKKCQDSDELELNSWLVSERNSTKFNFWLSNLKLPKSVKNHPNVLYKLARGSLEYLKNYLDESKPRSFSIKFIQELPPINVLILSMSASNSILSQYITVLKQSISTDSPFIAISHCGPLRAMLLSNSTVVLVVYLDAPLPDELRDLLISSQIIKISSSRQDIHNLNCQFKITIHPYVEDEFKVNQIRPVSLQSGSQQKPKDINKVCTYMTVLGLTPIEPSLVKEVSSTVYNAILSVFCIAYDHELKIAKGISSDSFDKQPCSNNSNDDEMFFDCIDTSCDENHPSLSKFLNSVSSQNPRVLILVQSVVMVVDTVFLVTDTCTLQLDVKPDHILPSSIVELLMNDDVIKEFVSTECTLTDFGSFFFVSRLESFIDRSAFLQKEFPLFFTNEKFQKCPKNVRSKWNRWLKKLKFPKCLNHHSSNSYKIARGSLEFLKNHSDDVRPQSFSIPVASVSQDVCKLIQCQSLIDQSHSISFVDPMLPVNLNDVIYRNDFLKIVVVKSQSCYPQTAGVEICFSFHRNNVIVTRCMISKILNY